MDMFYTILFVGLFSPGLSARKWGIPEIEMVAENLGDSECVFLAEALSENSRHRFSLDSQGSCLLLLMKWYRTRGARTYDSLEDALRRIGRDDLANRLTYGNPEDAFFSRRKGTRVEREKKPEIPAKVRKGKGDGGMMGRIYIASAIMVVILVLLILANCFVPKLFKKGDKTDGEEDSEGTEGSLEISGDGEKDKKDSKDKKGGNEDRKGAVPPKAAGPKDQKVQAKGAPPAKGKPPGKEPAPPKGKPPGKVAAPPKGKPPGKGPPPPKGKPSKGVKM